MHDLGLRLREIRRQRGLSMRQLTVLVGLSAHSNLADYETGRRLPPPDVVEACERALNIHDGELMRLRNVALARRASVAEPAAADLANPEPLGRRRVRTRRLVTAAAIVAALVVGWMLPRPGQAVAAAATGVSSCDSTAVILSSAALVGSDGQRLGTVSLRYSPSCSLAWARFIPTSTVTVRASGVVLMVHRVSDGATTSLRLSQVVAAESDPLLTVPGCVYAEATITVVEGPSVTGRSDCRQH